MIAGLLSLPGEGWGVALLGGPAWGSRALGGLPSLFPLHPMERGRRFCPVALWLGPKVSSVTGFFSG